MRLLTVTGRRRLWLASSGLILIWSCGSSQRFGVDTKGGDGGDTALAGESSGGASGFTDDAPVGGERDTPSSDGGVGGEQSESLTVLSTTPSDGAFAVEREVAIEVSFSANIDAKTVNAETFVVDGPNGVVAGELAVSGAKVTFTPEARWSLLADYSVALSSTIHSEGARPLSADYSFAFETRDGVFGKPQRLATATKVLPIMTGNQAGHVAVSWQTNETTSSVFVAMYDPVAETWGPQTPLETDSVNSYGNPCVALNEQGEGFAILGGSSGEVWSRYHAGEWGVVKLEAEFRGWLCALADDDTAVTGWADATGTSGTAFIATLSPKNVWSAPMTLDPKAATWGVARYGSGFLAVFERGAEGGVYSTVFDPRTGLSDPKHVFSGSLNYVSLKTFDTTALLTWNESGPVQAALFDGTAWTATDLGPGAEGIGSGAGPNGHVVAWCYQDNTYAALHDAKGGWADPIKLGSATPQVNYAPPAAAIDASGNALVAWPDGSNVVWRRSVHGSGEWTDAEQIEDQDPGFMSATVDGAGNVMLTWTNPLGIWATRFE
jgi:hypothetical protein